MRILISPDKFKGSLSAPEAAAAIRRGFQRIFPDAEFDLVPIADGGEGTAEIFRSVLGGTSVGVPAHDARGLPIEADYVWFEDRRTAVIEMSAASGLWRLDPHQLNPLRASTFGTGELMADALRRGAQTLYLALGGSATNDAGVGAARALGWKFLDAAGTDAGCHPETFSTITRIEPPAAGIAAEVIALCDVTNPLLGPTGATRIFGAQKGATPEQRDRLEEALEHIASLCRNQLDTDFANVPGAGATGGLAFGLMTFCGGHLKPGFSVIADLLDLKTRIARAALVVTGEGSLDAQTHHGKGPAEIARLARLHNRPVIALAGKIEGPQPDFDACLSLANGPLTLAESRRDAASLLDAAAERAARLLKISL